MYGEGKLLEFRQDFQGLKMGISTRIFLEYRLLLSYFLYGVNSYRKEQLLGVAVTFGVSLCKSKLGIMK